MNQTRASKVENGDKDISFVVNGVKEANPEIVCNVFSNYYIHEVENYTSVNNLPCGITIQSDSMLGNNIHWSSKQYPLILKECRPMCVCPL